MRRLTMATVVTLQQAKYSAQKKRAKLQQEKDNSEAGLLVR